MHSLSSIAIYHIIWIVKHKFKLGSQSTNVNEHEFSCRSSTLGASVSLRQLHGSLSSSFQDAQFHTVAPCDFDILTYHMSLLLGWCICEWCRHALFNLSWRSGLLAAHPVRKKRRLRMGRTLGCAMCPNDRVNGGLKDYSILFCPCKG